jgi:endonuclease/exonuclease/phosphatase family metal-dependent hydrolase
MTDISVVTWNLHHGVDKRAASMEATWRFIRDEIRPTVAIVQEADGIPATPGGHQHSRAHDAKYETAVVGYAATVVPLAEVVSPYSKVSFDLTPTIPGTYAIGELVDGELVDIDDDSPFVVVSLYGRILGGYSQMSILRAIADLVPLFDSPKYKRRIVLGGDLNAFDQPTGDRKSRRRWAILFDLFRSLGLVNLLQQTQPLRGPLAGCPCGNAACWHVETWRPASKRAVPSLWCLDYLFATKQLADRLTRLEIWGKDRPEVWEISDHCPLVARFDL